MATKILTRDEVNKNHTWDLSTIYATEKEFEAEEKRALDLADKLLKDFKGKICDAKTANEALDILRDFEGCIERLSNYRWLAVSVDVTNAEKQKQNGAFLNKFAKIFSELSFIDSELSKLPEEVINEAIAGSEENALYLKDLLRAKPHRLGEETEKVLSAFAPVFEAPEAIHMQIKMGDLDYENFTVDGKEHPLSFVMYENEYEIMQDTKVRRKAFELFAKNLRKYSNTMAANYDTQVKQEKIMATVRGHKSVFDYLLFDQKVDREMYNRQIDVIMKELAGPMRKYAKLLQKKHNLDKMTFPDLKMSLDYEFEPAVSVEESRKYIEEALSIYGDDYSNMLKRAFDERWIDFVQNKGKASGAFCASPYGAHPFVLISWSNRMQEVFVLAHELGHGGHFYLAQKNQNVFNSRPSLYFVESPSTMNELIMADYLMKQKPDDLRFRRWVLTSMITNTYFHNFVTHLLEGHFQREVYKIIDEGGSVQAEDLNRLKQATLEEFWGDAVEITKGADLTWMRQPHYYGGLYSYTYSASLTLGTVMARRIQKEGQSAIEDWKKVLKAGGTKTPVELAAMAGVDITTDKPLKETIAYISSIIDEIVELTEKIDGIKL